MLSEKNYIIEDLAGNQTTMIPMTDEQLATVEGGFPWFIAAAIVAVGLIIYDHYTTKK